MLARAALSRLSLGPSVHREQHRCQRAHEADHGCQTPALLGRHAQPSCLAAVRAHVHVQLLKGSHDTALRDGSGAGKTIAPKQATAAAIRALSMTTAGQLVGEDATARTTRPRRRTYRSDKGLHVTRVDHMHKRHAQHVGMHDDGGGRAAHGSPELQGVEFDRDHAFSDARATCAAWRTVTHGSCRASWQAAAAARVASVAVSSAVTTVVRQPQLMTGALVD